MLAHRPQHSDGARLRALQKTSKLTYLEACVVRVYKAFELADAPGARAAAGAAEEEDLT